MIMNYEVYAGFNVDEIADYFNSKRGWPVKTISRDNVDLVPVQNGAALECADGRFDQLTDRETHGYGVRVLGGINFFMALETKGNMVGLLKATELLKPLGATPGTHSADHGGCGFADLWIEEKLKSALHPYELDGVRGGLRIGPWLKSTMEQLGGKHHRVNGNHREVAVRLNPFRGYTERANCGSRFRIDYCFIKDAIANLDIPFQQELFMIAETVELLRPEAARLEIIIPSEVAA